MKKIVLLMSLLVLFTQSFAFSLKHKLHKEFNHSIELQENADFSGKWQGLCPKADVDLTIKQNAKQITLTFADPEDTDEEDTFDLNQLETNTKGYDSTHQSEVKLATIHGNHLSVIYTEIEYAMSGGLNLGLMHAFFIKNGDTLTLSDGYGEKCDLKKVS